MRTILASAPTHATKTARTRTLGSEIATVITYVLIFWVALPAFLLITGFRLDVMRPVVLAETAIVFYVGWSLLALGAAVTVAGMVQLWLEGRGLPISHLPPTRLVDRALYRYLRHPIYVGYTVAFAGIALLLGSFWCLAFSTPLLVTGWLFYTLYYEEPALVERFGSSYEAYRQRTRLLWPVPRAPRSPNAAPRILTRLHARLHSLANRPVLFRRGALILVTYGVFCALGALLFVQSNCMLLVQQGMPSSHIGLFLVGGTLASSFLAWFFWWAGNARTLIHERWWGLGRNGFVSYGGLAGFLFVAIAFGRLFGYAPLMLTDVLMQGIFFAYALGRIGCLTYGCCYGIPTTRPYGVVYEHPEAKMIRLGDHRRVARHPVQLYSCAHAAVALVLVNAMVWASIPVGLVTAAALMLGGLGRAFTESYRERKRSFLGRFTYGHVGSGVTFLAGWLLLFFLSPVVDAHAPQPWSVTALVESLALLPFVLLSALLVLIIFGMHWKRLGYWAG